VHAAHSPGSYERDANRVAHRPRARRYSRLRCWSTTG
jgi:hypothetical protein